MKVILLENDEAYKKLMTDIKVMIREAIKEINESSESEVWVSAEEAKKILGVKSKSKMQQLRDENKIRYSQIGKKIIRYHKPSLYTFIEKNSYRD